MMVLLGNNPIVKSRNICRCRVFLRIPKCKQVGQIIKSNKTCMVSVSMQREQSGNKVLKDLQAGKLTLVNRHSQEAQQATLRTTAKLGGCFAGSNLWANTIIHGW